MIMNANIPKGVLNEIVDMLKEDFIEQTEKVELIELGWSEYQDTFEKALNKLKKLGLDRATVLGQDPSNTKH